MRVLSSMGRGSPRAERCREGRTAPVGGTDVGGRPGTVPTGPGARDQGPAPVAPPAAYPAVQGPRPAALLRAACRGGTPGTARVTTDDQTAITVFLLDDHEVVRRGVADVLE